MEKEHTHKNFLSRGYLLHGGVVGEARSLCWAPFVDSFAGWPLVLVYEVNWLALACGNPWQSTQPFGSCSTGTPLV
jgi:hypothetical protein